MLTEETRRLCVLFADTLDYPDGELPGAAMNCAREMERSHPGAAAPVREFAGFANIQSQATMEELYAQTFDLTAATTLYFGHHLFGETPRRSAFLVSLQEAYQACSFSPGMELGDHLGVILRFLSVTDDADFVLPLLDECLLPNLERMEDELHKNRNPYAGVIGPLRTFLKDISHQLAKTGGVRNA